MFLHALSLGLKTELHGRNDIIAEFPFNFLRFIKWLLIIFTHLDQLGKLLKKHISIDILKPRSPLLLALSSKLVNVLALSSLDRGLVIELLALKGKIYHCSYFIIFEFNSLIR